MKIISDKVNKNNIDLVLSEINDFTKPYQVDDNTNEVFNEVMSLLKKI